MEYLDIIIVCSPDRYFPQLVMDHLLIQDIPIRLFFSNVKGDGAASARNFAKEMWQNNPNRSHYILMSDNDIVLPRGSLQAMIRFLDQHPDFGAISLHRHEAEQLPETEASEPSHVNAGPVLFRTEVYDQMTYHNNDGCECQGMSNDVRKLGYRIGYLGSWKYDHIDRTKRNDLGGQPHEQIPPPADHQMAPPPVDPNIPQEIPPPGEEMIDSIPVEEPPPPDQNTMEVNIPSNREHLPEPMIEHPDAIADQAVEEMPADSPGIEAHPYEDPGTPPIEESVEEPVPEVDQPPLGEDSQIVHQILETISYQLSELISESKAIRTLLEQRPQ